MPVRFQDTQKTNFRFFITVQGESMMGVDLFDALGGAVSLGSTVIVSQPSSPSSCSVRSRATSPAPSRPSAKALRRAVRGKQAAMAADHDRRVHARPTSIVPGDLVRIRLPRRSHKLAQSYSELLTVKSVKGNYATLQNGQRWNIRRCLLAKSSLTGPRADPGPVTTH